MKASPGPRRVRHRRRGSTYTVIGAATMQSAVLVQEGDVIVVYRSEADGQLWARPVMEFHDGRFEELPAGDAE